jgi:hypothetical protein
MRRATASRLLAGGSVLLVVVALVLTYAGRAVLRSGPFADRAAAALRDPAVQQDVADRLTAAVVSGGAGELAPVRPLVRALAGAIVANDAFNSLFRRAVREAHHAVVDNGGGAAFVNVADAAVLLQAALSRLAPDAAKTVRAERVVELLTVRPGSAALEAIRVAKAVYLAAWAFAGVAIALAAGSLWLAADRAAAARRLALGVALGGLAIVALYLVGSAIVRQAAPTGRGAAAAALWRALLGGLRTEALLMVGAAAIVAATAGAPTRAGLVQAANRPRGAIAWSLLAVAAGAAIALEPVPALTVATVAVGALLVAMGVAGVMRRLLPRVARPRLRRPALAAVAAVALAGAVALVATGDADEAPAAAPLACDGHAALCGRRLNEVSFAATHNSFASVTLKDFLFGQQDGTIADQLRFGVRGFLIDTYYGYETGQRVTTDLASLPKRDLAVRELGAPAVEAAERLRARLGSKPRGSRDIYLCHGFCELGAVSLSSALADLRSFLVENPGEVAIVVNQDEGVAPADLASAFDRAGLLDMVYRGPLDRFPTLREMVDSGQRLVVLAENDAGSIPGYRLAYQQALQETPFRFTSPAELTSAESLAAGCRANRGPTSAPLFLLNNWIDTTPVPRPSNAELVNAHATLLRRARTCMRIRDRLPNLIAVDFYRRGDVLGVVDDLNRVPHK